MLDPVRNFAEATVSTEYASGVTTVALTTGGGAELPDPATDGAFNLVWFNFTDYPNPADDPNVEIVRVTARSADTLTITRAQEGTGDNNHNTAGKTYKMMLTLTKKTIDDIRAKLWVHDYTPSEAVNGSNTVFTLPSASAVIVYADGMRLKGGGVDYTFSGNTTITFVSERQPYTTISIDYLEL